MKVPYNRNILLSLMLIKESIGILKKKKLKSYTKDDLDIFWLKYGFLILNREKAPQKEPFFLCRLFHVNGIGFTVCRIKERWCIYADNLEAKCFTQESVVKSWYELAFGVVLRAESQDKDIPDLDGADELVAKLIDYERKEKYE